MTEKEYAMVIARNLKRIAWERQKTQVEIAKDLHISKATISAWMNGTRTPKMPKIDMLCAYFNVKRSDIMDPPDNSRRRVFPNVKAVRIPVLGRVAAGIPIDAIEDILDWEEITEEKSRTGEFFGLRIKGDSMMPRICENDIVIVRQQQDAESGDIVIAQVNGDTATCKKLIKHPDGISLISFNPLYEPMCFNNREIQEIPVEIIGKVVENRQKY